MRKVMVFSVQVISFALIFIAFSLIGFIFVFICFSVILTTVLWPFFCSTAHHLIRLDGSGGDDFDKLAIGELFEVLVRH